MVVGFIELEPNPVTIVYPAVLDSRHLRQLGITSINDIAVRAENPSRIAQFIGATQFQRIFGTGPAAPVKMRDSV